MPTPEFLPPHVQGLLTPLAEQLVAASPAENPKPRGERAFGFRLDDPADTRRLVAALYREHKALVYRLALRYGKGNVAWAEDITQEVFIDLMKALPNLTDHDQLEGWLYRATTHRCFCRLRRERFRLLAPLRWLLGERQNEPTQPEALAIARDDLRRAAEALSAMPAKEQIAFSMYYLDGKEQEEIGEVLGHSKGYVCKLIQRAVEKLGKEGWEVPR